MNIYIITLGRITEIVGKKTFIIADIRDTDKLRSCLLKCFPHIESVSYAIAINEEMVFGKTFMADGDTVAILPPFSGG